MTIIILTQPPSGEVNIGENPVEFTPGTNFIGVTTFIYQICDGSISSATVTVTGTSVKVQSPADESLTEETATNLDVVGNDILIDQ